VRATDVFGSGAEDPNHDPPRGALLIALTTAGLLPVASAAVVPVAPTSAAVVSCHYSIGPQTETVTDSAGHVTEHKSIVIYS
jgi:hypothetical protein